MTKKAIIITGRLVQDHEFIYPFYRLKEEGFEVDTFVEEKNNVLGYFGTKIPPTKDDKIVGIGDYNIHDYSLMVLPGGVKSMEHLRLKKEIIQDIIKFNSQGKLIAAICSGTMMLISANIIEGKKITGYYAWKDDIENAGGIFIDKPCVIDSNLVTSPHYKYNGEWMKGVIETYKKNNK
tara:strand:- start:851 stop:1387 length:537 start_codon:yes stop_codon:yes gene_type:complete